MASRHVKSAIAIPSLPQFRQVERILSSRIQTKQTPGAGGIHSAAIAFDGTDINENEMSVVIPFADGNDRDGVGDVVEVLGIKTERHRKNPIALFDHGKTVTLPIGLCEDRNGQYTVVRDGDSRKAYAPVYFYQGVCPIDGLEQCQKDEHALFCEQLFHLIVVRVVRAGSFGYLVLDARPLREDAQSGKPKGLHLLATELLELGPVVLPANGDAVRKYLEDGACGKPLARPLYKSLEPYAAELKVMANGYGEKGRDWDQDKFARIPTQTLEELWRKYSPSSRAGGSPPDRTALEQSLWRIWSSGSYGFEDIAHVIGLKDISNKERNLSDTDLPSADWKPGQGAKENVGDARPQPSAKKSCHCENCEKGLECCGMQKQLPSESADVSPEKARQILSDGEVYGKPLTEAQRGLFGAIAGNGDKKTIQGIREKYQKKGKKQMKGKKGLDANTKDTKPISRNGDTSMSEKKEKGMVRRIKAAPEGVPDDADLPEYETKDHEEMGVTDPPMDTDEKLGAQVLRRIYQDQEDMLADYDQLQSLLEEEGVTAFVQEKLEAITECMSAAEGLFSEKYPDYPPLGGGGEVEAEAEPEEELEEPEEPEEKAENLEELEETSDEPVPPEEVTEGMQTKKLQVRKSDVGMGFEVVNRSGNIVASFNTQQQAEQFVKEDEFRKEDTRLLGRKLLEGKQEKAMQAKSTKLLRSKYGKKDAEAENKEDKKEEKKDEKAIEPPPDEPVEGKSKQLGEEELGNLGEVAKFLKQMSLDPGISDEARQKAGNWYKAVEEMATVPEQKAEEPKAEATPDTVPEGEGMKGIPEQEIYMAGLQAKALEQEKDIEELKGQLIQLTKVLP